MLVLIACKLDFLQESWDYKTQITKLNSNKIENKTYFLAYPLLISWCFAMIGCIWWFSCWLTLDSYWHSPPYPWSSNKMLATAAVVDSFVCWKCQHLPTVEVWTIHSTLQTFHSMICLDKNFLFVDQKFKLRDRILSFNWSCLARAFQLLSKKSRRQVLLFATVWHCILLNNFSKKNLIILKKNCSKLLLQKRHILKDHIYRMVIVEGRCTMARSSSLGANYSLVDTKV